MDKILLTLFVLFIANAASFVQNDVFVVVIFLCCAFLFIKRKLRFDKQFYALLGVWTVINIISYAVNNVSIDESLSFVGLTLKILIAYMIVKIVGSHFFDKLFDYLIILILLSSPFYLLELIMPDIMSSLSSVLNFMTKAKQTDLGGYYIYIYMHNPRGVYDSIIRNSGFMWEPGAYACVLTFMLVYYLHKMKYRFSPKVWIIIISLISTFSTSGLISLFFVMFFCILRSERLKKISYFIPILLLVLLIVGYDIYKSNEFMSDKIELYLDTQDDIKEVDDGSGTGETFVKVNRVGIAIISVDNAFRRPWGEGAFISTYIKTVYMGAVGNNSLAELLRQWGWLGLLALYYALYMFKIDGRKMGWLLPVAMTPVLFSNPFAFRMLIYAIVFSVLCIPSSQNYMKSICLKKK